MLSNDIRSCPFYDFQGYGQRAATVMPAYGYGRVTADGRNEAVQLVGEWLAAVAFQDNTLNEILDPATGQTRVAG
jgi:hypothetical protein